MHTHPALHLPWRVLVGTVGTVVILAGIAMLIVPGPGITSILLGLLVLSTEFRWAHRLLRPARVWARRGEKWAIRTKNDLLERYRGRRSAKAARRDGTAPPSPPSPPDAPGE
ncbi:PGPGW domain-containing protein [Nocardiopsis ganjiahuensis]|uniref:PGPGW domain-containing protein n=1 Tax=Nocardiopsis ganjiahuensis TaxID=239984 RepID=UPI00034D1C40|nr:PGPGW domain-containing protein [Nocardiopsis ganjiahuensis]